MNRNIIIIVVCWVASIGLFLGLIYPKYQNWQTLLLGIKEKNAELQTKTEYFTQIKETTETLNTYEEALSKISSALPADSALPSLTNFLQTTASETGMSLDKVSIDSINQSNEQKRLNETKLTLEVSGSYDGFKSFLSGLEQSARMISLSDLSFETPKKTKDPFIFNLSIKTFSY
jgi:Tfp pilus assembly protein PilO